MTHDGQAHLQVEQSIANDRVQRGRVAGCERDQCFCHTCGSIHQSWASHILAQQLTETRGKFDRMAHHTKRNTRGPKRQEGTSCKPSGMQIQYAQYTGLRTAVEVSNQCTEKRSRLAHLEHCLASRLKPLSSLSNRVGNACAWFAVHRAHACSLNTVRGRGSSVRDRRRGYAG